MSNKIIPFPFSSAFSAYKQTRNQDTKKVIFKNFLETYVKMNMALHLSWILKFKKHDIPGNLRVQIVQLFQKPPSIGFCHAICKAVNPILVNEVEEDSQLSYFGKFFDKNEQAISRLIEIRNAEAHGNLKMDKDLNDEIKENLQKLVMQPLFTSSCLMIAGSDDLNGVGIEVPSGIQEKDCQFLLLKEEMFIEDDQSELDGNELSLFPFAISNMQDEICLWNQRAGKKGTYTNYLSENIIKTEISGVTEFAGFPYDDWKKSSNPVYVNYLTSRTKVLDELLNDENTGIEDWHNEIMHAFRLERDLNLNQGEKIGLKPYVSGILQKIEKVDDDEVRLMYHRRIFDLRDNLESNETTDKPYLVNEIFKSCTILLWNALDKNLSDKFNLFYPTGMDLIIKRLYITDIVIDEQLIEFLGGQKRFITKYKLYNIWRLLNFATFLILLLVTIFYLKSFYLLIGLFISVYFLYLFLKKHANNITNIFIEQKQTKKSIIKNLFYLNQISAAQNLALNLENIFIKSSEKINYDLLKILSVQFIQIEKLKGNFVKIFLKITSDFQKIFLNDKKMFYLLTQPKSEVIDDSFFKITSDDWVKYKNKNFDSESISERSYLQRKLNSLVFNQNNIKINQLFQISNNQALDINHFETYFWEGTNRFQEDWTHHNYILGWCAAAVNDLNLSISYFKKSAFEGKGEFTYYALFNLAQVYFAQNRVTDGFLIYTQFKNKISDESEDVVMNLDKGVISLVNKQLKGLEERFFDLYEMNFSEANLKKTNLIWRSNQEFTFKGKYIYMNENVNITLKYNHSE